MHYLYILYSTTSDIYYVGQSSDPWRRVVQHNENTQDKFTGKHSNWKLAAVFEVSSNKGDADKLEKFINGKKANRLY